MISPLKPDKEKNQWHVLIKKKLRAPSIKRKPGTNTMHTFFYSNITEFSGNLEGMLDEGTYKIIMQNMHKLVWKAQKFKSTEVLMLGHSCSVSQYPQFYDTIKNMYQMLPRPYMGIYSGEKGHQFLHKPRVLELYK